MNPEIEKCLLTDKEIIRATYFGCVTDADKAIAQAQAEKAYKAGEVEGRKSVIRWLAERRAKPSAPITFDTLGVEECILIKIKDWQLLEKELED